MPPMVPEHSRGLKSAGNARCRILLADRHAVMRTAAAAWIRQSPDLAVCGVVRGLPLVEPAIRRWRPDAVVLEISGESDLRLVRELRRRHPRLPILVFAALDEAVYGPLAQTAGANGFLAKKAGGEQLIHAIRRLPVI